VPIWNIRIVIINMMGSGTLYLIFLTTHGLY